MEPASAEMIWSGMELDASAAMTTSSGPPQILANAMIVPPSVHPAQALATPVATFVSTTGPSQRTTASAPPAGSTPDLAVKRSPEPLVTQDSGTTMVSARNVTLLVPNALEVPQPALLAMPPGPYSLMPPAAAPPAKSRRAGLSNSSPKSVNTAAPPLTLLQESSPLSPPPLPTLTGET